MQTVQNLKVKELCSEEEWTVDDDLPPDPAAPFYFSDYQESLKPAFSLRPDQLADVERLWNSYQNYTPAYSDIADYVTIKELEYMLKAMNLMTYTVDQFHELVEYCCRPPHPEGHITFQEFVKMVTIRERDTSIENKLRNALLVFQDPDRPGTINRKYFKEMMIGLGHKISRKEVDVLVKELDMSNDGSLGIDDIVSTMSIDLNYEEIKKLQNQVYGTTESQEEISALEQNEI